MIQKLYILLLHGKDGFVMKKKFLIIVLIIFIIVIFTNVIVFVKNINNLHSDIIVDKPVTIVDLNGKISFEDAVQISIGDHFDVLTQKYHINAIKKKKDIYYTVFNITDYGRIYISMDKNFTIIQKKIVVDKNLTDFKSLQNGQSTFNDVVEIDKSTKIILSNQPCSIHWLSDGRIITINYSPDKVIQSVELLENSWHDYFYSSDW